MNSRNLILIVEDEQDHADLMTMYLENSGHDFEVGHAACLEDARGAIKSNPPAVVVVDINLKDGSGLELIAAAGPGCKVVIATCHDDPETRQDAIAKGADWFLVKSPEMMRELPETLARILAGGADG